MLNRLLPQTSTTELSTSIKPTSLVRPLYHSKREWPYKRGGLYWGRQFSSTLFASYDGDNSVVFY